MIRQNQNMIVIARVRGKLESAKAMTERLQWKQIQAKHRTNEKDIPCRRNPVDATEIMDINQICSCISIVHI